MNPAELTPGVRRAITAFAMAATFMNALDTTIANVALPHIQGSLAASADEITWVLTSYIISAAIMTSLSGWLADRFGRKRLMLWSVAGFTAASGLCGVAQTLDQIILFRFLQGVFGASLMPMSQATLLDINPPERHASAMAVWSMGALLAPILGPATGGWLTDNLTWRWVFYINLPIGIVTWMGFSAFLPDTRTESRRFDLFGFLMLALAIGSFQLMLDRGQTKDWFSSTEICLEAAGAVFFGYLFLAHILTAKRPFIDLALFTDRNFVFGSMLGFFLNVVLFGVLALLPPMLERLMGYPVVLTGLVTAPRGVGTLISMAFVSQIMKRVDVRIVIVVGLAMASFSVWNMSGFSLDMDARIVVVSGFVQGLGTGMLFVALSTVTFGTLPARLRNEGAGMFMLIRNIGSAAGISVLQALTVRTSAAAHARLTEGIRPDNPIMQTAAPGFDFSAPAAVARMNAEISRQAAMISYIDVFWMLFLTSLCVMPLIFFVRPPRKAATDEDIVLHVE